MKLLKWILGSFLVLLIVLSLSAYGLYKYKNRRIKPDYHEVYKKQDTVPVGKVGIFATALIMPEKLDTVFFYNISQKVFKNIIPWPFRIFAQMDRGVALLDPEKYYEFEEFVPSKLEDLQGNDCYLDGQPYIEKYRRGEVIWVPPSTNIHKDHGYFLYTGHKGGMSSFIGKIINKSRLWYYGKGNKQKILPHWEGSFTIINSAFDKVREKYGDVECRAETSMHYHNIKKKLFELLDAGCDTIVLAAPMAIYSHFEEFNSSFYHCFEYIHQWEKAHPGKKVKVIMAPPMGQFEPLRTAYLKMLKDRLDTLPAGSDVTVAVSVHGMPWDRFPWEAWLEFAPRYRDPLVKEVEELLQSYTFERTNVVLCQEEFASEVWDPQNKYVSSHEVYWDAINDEYDYVISLPIEFFVENSDSLFYFFLKNYYDFDDYDRYAQVDYSDWSVPFTSQHKQGNTTIIYNGLPVGEYQPYVIEAFYQALDSILKQG
jgi:hypothetical protein